MEKAEVIQSSSLINKTTKQSNSISLKVIKEMTRIIIIKKKKRRRNDESENSGFPVLLTEVQ